MSNDQNNVHYLCPKCKIFPLIKFCKDRKHIRINCSCSNNIKILIDDFFKQILTENNLSSSSSILSEENNNLENCLFCKKHNRPFYAFSKILFINFCKFCKLFNDNDDIIIFDDIYIENEKIEQLKKIINVNNKKSNEDICSNDYKNIETNDGLCNILSEEEDNFNMLIKIIINDYKNFPNFSHFFNIKNLLYFFNIEDKPLIKQKKENLDNNINKDYIITIEYKNNFSYETKLFNKTFVENNNEKCKIEIEGKILSLIEKYEFKTKEEKVRIKLFINDGVSEIDLYKMFANCTDLLYVNGLAKLNKIKIVNMNKIFYNCSSLLSIPDINALKIEKKYHYLMFFNCISLIFFPYEKEFSMDKYDDSFLGIIITKYLKYNKDIIISNIAEDNEGFINLFKNKYKIPDKEEEIDI